ncbi:hypothetical protein BaRGS_00002126 [Batillaria attramentaria]|uniref:Uncharacterized protein n=1 Tax=Batillaria attramentaria TaxID=370345 RepID=A0ABD0M4D1_9CAEN
MLAMSSGNRPRNGGKTSYVRGAGFGKGCMENLQGRFCPHVVVYQNAQNSVEDVMNVREVRAVRGGTLASPGSLETEKERVERPSVVETNPVLSPYQLSDARFARGLPGSSILTMTIDFARSDYVTPLVTAWR